MVYWCTQAMNDEESCLQTENIRRVLEVERRMEGGCAALLDKDQTLLREGLDPAPSSSLSLSSCSLLFPPSLLLLPPLPSLPPSPLSNLVMQPLKHSGETLRNLDTKVLPFVPGSRVAIELSLYWVY